MINNNDVTIIIPHLGASSEAEYAIEQCFKSLKETVPDIKIIISVNGMKCGGHLFFNQCEQLYLTEQGQNKAVNAAIATTNTSWVFISNDDMVYAPGWFEKLIDTEIIGGRFNHFPCISPRLVEPRKGAPTFIEYFCGGAGGDFDKEKWLEFARNYQGVGVRTGFNLPLLMHRDLWNTIEGYDVNMDPWGSNADSEIEYKVRLAGVQPYQNGDCVVYHFSQTSGTFEPRNQSYWQKNWEYFKNKWGFYRADERIWEADFHMPSKEEGRIFTPEWEGKYLK